MSHCSIAPLGKLCSWISVQGRLGLVDVGHQLTSISLDGSSCQTGQYPAGYKRTIQVDGFRPRTGSRHNRDDPHMHDGHHCLCSAGSHVPTAGRERAGGRLQSRDDRCFRHLGRVITLPPRAPGYLLRGPVPGHLRAVRQLVRGQEHE